MKSSSLHRSGLTRERMAMFEDTRVTGFDKFDKAEKPVRLEKSERGDLPQYTKVQKSSELDLLYKGIERSFAKAAVSAQFTKTPGVYLAIGFVAGLIVMFVISLIVTISSGNVKPAGEVKAPVAVVAADKYQDTPTVTEERYVIKSGDTLDKIAVRFYGKYDNEKINQIQAINNIKNPASLQIGQVIIVPVNK